MGNTSEKAGFRTLKPDDVVCGEPLRWAVHDEQGHLLLAKGVIVRTENQRARLVNQRVLVALNDDELAEQRKQQKAAEEDKNYVYRQKGVDVFKWVDLHYELLASSYALLAEGPSPEAVSQLRRLAVALQKAADKNSEGLLAAVFLSGEGKSNAMVKALHVALLCHELARINNLSPEARLSLIAAGLTHDVAMWQMQDEIQLREAPLSDAQWQSIRTHTQVGVELLQQSGVRDPLWLSAVDQHHERLNGSGYHAGLTDAKISPQARMLAIADVFAAMVRPRGDRGKRVPKDAMREIFMSRGEEIDSTMVQLFIKKIGMFPPGCMLRLVSGEIGIATGSSNNASSPDVAVFIGANNQPLSRPAYRDTSTKGFSVKEFVSELPHPSLEELLPTLWNPVAVTL